MDDNQLLRYSRHLFLPQIGIEGQTRLMEAHMLIIGAGGLGCPAALYLASSGVGKLVISDDDTIDLANLQRQIAYETEDVGQSKTATLQKKLLAINPEVSIDTVPRLSEEALISETEKADIVLDCSDNFATRYLVNQVCVSVKTPLISATVTGFSGQISLFASHTGTACYQCLYPDSAANRPLSCADSGVLAPVAGMMGTLQALEAIKFITNVGVSLKGKLLTFDALNMQCQYFTLNKDITCPVCQEEWALK